MSGRTASSRPMEATATVSLAFIAPLSPLSTFYLYLLPLPSTFYFCLLPFTFYLLPFTFLLLAGSGLLFVASHFENVVQTDVRLMARVLVDRPLARDHGKRGRPRAHERVRIVDGEL